MRLECIAIGTELLTAGRLDTNSLWLADRLAAFGLSFHRKTVVGDDPIDLQAAFREALERSDWVLCTGGLGPTFDDVTKELWAEVFDDELVEDPAAREEMLAFFKARHREPAAANFKQVLIPRSARALRNPVGTAPGVMWVNPPGHPGRTVVLMPGVPREMKAMWESQVEPLLAPLTEGQAHTLRLVVGSVPEATLEERSRPLREAYAHLDWTILSNLSHVELLARSRDPQALEALRHDARALLGEDLAREGEGGVEHTVLERLEARGETLALAESMSGGAIAARLTAVPGASRTLTGGALVYSPEAKRLLAGVSEATLAEHGTVSEATSLALAEGIRARLGATWGLAVTGHAGPTEDPGGTGTIGTTCVAVAGPGGTWVTTFHFPGARVDIQTRAASWALDFLRRCL